MLLGDEFNASIQQIPRYGLFGGGTNYLVIGLPLLMALDRGRFCRCWPMNTATCAATMAALVPGFNRTRHPGCSLNKNPATIPAWLGFDAGVSALVLSTLCRQTLRWRGRMNTRPTTLLVALAGREVMAAALIEVEIAGAGCKPSSGVTIGAWRPIGVASFRGLRRLRPAPRSRICNNDALRQSLKRISNLTTPTPVCETGWKRLDAAGTLAGMVARQRPGPAGA